MQTCDDLYPASATTTFTCSDDPMYTSIAGAWRYISGGTFTTENSAFYISDTFDIGDRLTIEAGLRSSSFKNNNANGETFIGVDNQVAPRFAAVYNSGNASQSKWFGSYGEYYLPIATNTNIRMSGAEFYTESYYQWDGNLDNVTDAGPTNKNFLYTDEYADGTVPDVAAVLDQNIKPMYQSEFILGNEQVLANGLVLGVKAIYRDLATTIEDILIDEGMWNHFAGTENEDDILAYYGGSSHYVLTNPGTDIKVYDEVTGEVVTITAAEAAIPAPSRTYKALELSLTKSWDGRSGWNANYTLGSSYGNLEGWVRSDNNQDDAGITSLFDSGDMTVNGTGYLPNDRRHTLKLYGTKAVGDRLTVGTNIIWQTGRPKNCFGNGPAGSIQYTNSMFYCDGAIAERGSRGRQPSVMNMDINAQYTINLGNHDVVLTANIFNIFDTHTVKETVEQNTGYYGYTTSMQPARAARLGFRYTFN
jgi:hypothetical protein